MALPLERGCPEWWRRYFRSSGVDIYETTVKAFQVFAEDQPEEFSKRSASLIQELLSLTWTAYERAGAGASKQCLHSSGLSTQEGDRPREQPSGKWVLCDAPSSSRPRQQTNDCGKEDEKPVETRPRKVFYLRLKRTPDVSAPCTPSPPTPVRLDTPAPTPIQCVKRIPPTSNVAAASMSASDVTSTTTIGASADPKFATSSPHHTQGVKESFSKTRSDIPSSAPVPYKQNTRFPRCVEKQREEFDELWIKKKTPKMTTLLPATTAKTLDSHTEVNFAATTVASSVARPPVQIAPPRVVALKAVVGDDINQEMQTRMNITKRKLRDGYQQDIDRKRARKIQVIDPRDLPRPVDAKKNVQASCRIGRAGAPRPTRR